MTPGRITSFIGNNKFEVRFPGDNTVEVLDKKDISPNGFAPPDWFKSVYNLAQVSLSVYCGIFGIPVIFDFITHPFGVNLPMQPSAPLNKALHYCICVHFLSKFLDYVDTFLIIIGKKDKQLSVLHVYHHCSISMVWGYLIFNNYAFGTVCFGAWINAVVHSIMYSYYGLTAASVNGRRLFNTKPFKPYVTSIQLTQFFLCITHAIVVIIAEKAIPFGLAALQFGYHCTMIALFGQFFYENYYVNKSSSKNKSSSSSSNQTEQETKKPKKKKSMKAEE
jgi:elongation of very long chain fatty acids protein 4